MLQPSSRPLRTLLLAAALAGGTATAAAPAFAAPAGPAKAAKKAKTKKVADLTVRGLSFEILSDSIEVDASIANTGSGRANRSTTTVAISGDGVLDASDDIVATTPTNRLKPGASAPLTTEFEIPETLPDGDLYLLVCADGSGAVKERAETNNCAVELLASADDAIADEDDESDEADDDSADIEVADGE